MSAEPLFVASTIPTGPSTLGMMPDGQQAGLDDYMAQIVTNRKSGLSLNHIIGCPLDCGYCVRHFWGNFEQKTPQLLVSTTEAVEMLTGHEAFRPHSGSAVQQGHRPDAARRQVPYLRRARGTRPPWDDQSRPDHHPFSRHR